MLKIVLLLVGAFDVVLCEIQTRLETSQVPSCGNPLQCYSSDTYKSESKSVQFLPYPSLPNYGRRQLNLHQRSYYSGLGSSTSPAYYPTFDPISVLGSLAFLAFLLQSFASLFDRSRSMLPTIVSGRQSAVDSPEISTHMSHALQEYENLNKDLERK